MKVKELKKLLEGYDDEMVVCIEQPTHDYWGTKKAPTVGRVEEANRDENDKLWDDRDGDEMQRICLITT